MKLNTSARYAVMAMVDLAFNVNENKACSLHDIARRQELPLAYLEQLFSKLKKAHLVTGIRGASGGYTLTRTPDNIRLSDIIYAVRKPTKTTRCDAHSKKGCHSSGNRCATHDLWDALGQTIQNFFSKITLADVLNKDLPITTTLTRAVSEHPDLDEVAHVL